MADDRPDAAEVIARIRMTNAQLDRLLLGVGVARLNQPGAVGIWSVKDVISHIAFWERYAVRILQAIRRGETPDTAAEDETEVRNASVVAQYYLQPWSRVLASWHEARDELIEELAGFSAEELNSPDRYPWREGRPLLQLIAGSSYEHEQEHYDQIRAWLTRSSD